MSKDMALKILIWSVPVVFGAGAFVQLVTSDTASLGDQRAEVEAQFKLL